MTPMMSGFADELVKLASRTKDPVFDDAKMRVKAQNSADSIVNKIPDAQKKRRKNYLASSVLGAALFPAAALSGRGMTRIVRNLARSKGTKPVSLLSKAEPLTTRSELAGLATQGALSGSVTRSVFDKIEDKSSKS